MFRVAYSSESASCIIGEGKEGAKSRIPGERRITKRDLEIGETAKITSLTNHEQASATGIWYPVLNRGSQQATQVFLSDFF